MDEATKALNEYVTDIYKRLKDLGKMKKRQLKMEVHQGNILDRLTALEAQMGAKGDTTLSVEDRIDDLNRRVGVTESPDPQLERAMETGLKASNALSEDARLKELVEQETENEENNLQRSADSAGIDRVLDRDDAVVNVDAVIYKIRLDMIEFLSSWKPKEQALINGVNNRMTRAVRPYIEQLAEVRAERDQCIAEVGRIGRELGQTQHERDQLREAVTCYFAVIENRHHFADAEEQEEHRIVALRNMWKALDAHPNSDAPADAGA